MPRIVRTSLADSDVLDIASYIGRHNLSAATRLIAKINQTLERLAESPGLGPERPELQPSLRSYPIGNYLLFYRPLPDGITLVRVAHGARRLDRLFKNP